MHVPFTKMHGLGNDFVLIRGDGLGLPAPERIRQLADRHRGIGFDQLLWLEAPRRAGDDVHYRIFNTDGSEAEQCGNGARCIARLVARPGQQELRLGHGTGSVRARMEEDGAVTVEMAVPELRPAAIPFEAPGQAPRYTLVAGDETVEAGVVSLGNPHAVLQVANVETAPVQKLGPRLERHERFPNRANIGFMQVLAPDRIRLRVFERGVGETSACGTGACAAVVIGRTWGLLEPRVAVELPGGTLQVRWDGPGFPVWMTGEAVTVFEGTIQV
ncbi:MAG: diaminopimelate epimerase [Chromatiales bacterium]|nr:diaminopimelate epimerase [Chromatiales bacterium]